MRSLAFCLAVTVLLSAALPPAPARAMSTAKEVAIGEAQNKQIDDENNIITDPFLTDWVNGIGAKLAANRYRTDITYRFEILGVDDINAFALPGGFMHADLGLLNFVGSDDELAAVLGHEMGHVERRHVITLNTKANILSVLIGVLSILSPIAYLFGGYGGELAINKLSREDELQADQYGLLLMRRAGYDPQGAVDLMAHLAKLSEGGPQESRTDVWLEDHPEPKDRIAHLEGYPGLNNPSAAQITAYAIHDQDEGRYSYARVRLQQALAKDPGNALARAHAAEVAVALTDVPGPALRAVASTQAQDVYGLGEISAAVARAEALTKADAGLAAQRAKSSSTDLETLFNLLQGQTNGAPNLGSPKKAGNNLAQAIDGLHHIARAINGTLSMTQDVLSNAGSLAAQNMEPLHNMAGSLAAASLSDTTRVLLPSYPLLASRLSAAGDHFVRAVDDARAAIAMSNDAVKQLGTFLAALNAVDTTGGDIAAKNMPPIAQAMTAALTSWDAAQAMAQRASDLMYAAQTATLSANLSLLDLYSSPARYDAYRKAVAFRFPGVTLPDYEAVAGSAVTPGELGCDAWLSYETKEPVERFIAEETASGVSCPDIALARHLFGESMEIAEGLLYEDYIEVPERP
jgi:predicted Zn-dependent protease